MDHRVWRPTDRAGESISVSQVGADIEIVSVHGSTRYWRETHTATTLALIHTDKPGVGAEWRTRAQDASSRAGSIMCMEPGELHVTKHVFAGAGGVDFDVVRFSPELVARAAHELGLRGQFHLRAPTLDDPITFGALEKLVASVAAGEDKLTIDSVAAQTLNTVITRGGEAPTATGVTLDPIRDSRLRRVKKHLRENLAGRPSLEELESVAGLSQYRLCALFKRAYGVTLGQYWNALRLAEAVRRLQQGVPVKLVVAELGYGDEPYLSRVFKRHYGMAPGAWLNLYRANDWSKKRPSYPPPP